MEVRVHFINAAGRVVADRWLEIPPRAGEVVYFSEAGSGYTVEAVEWMLDPDVRTAPVFCRIRLAP